MYTPTLNMDCERYQDLSELGWCGRGAQPWEAAEPANPISAIMHSDGSQSGLAYENCIDYNINDLDGPFYTMTRTDSMEEVKAVTAPMEVVPMRHHETLQVQDFVKTECEDIGRNEEVGGEVEPKVDPDFMKVDPDLLLFDSQDLLTELGDRDLIDYLVSEGSPRSQESPRVLNTPPPITSKTRLPDSPRRQKTPLWAQVSPLVLSPPPSKKKNTAMRETYLAIPRELTAGSSDDKKIPKMLILKTPQTSTINLQDMGMSIAERIKTAGKRPRPKRYSEVSECEEDDDEDDDDADENYEEDEDQKPRKRMRRLSTTSSASTSDRYRELRDKNNEASRKSRQNRKEKEKDLMMSLDKTERENLRLRARSDELEKLVLSLRKLLLQIVVSKGSAR